MSASKIGGRAKPRRRKHRGKKRTGGVFSFKKAVAAVRKRLRGKPNDNLLVSVQDALRSMNNRKVLHPKQRIIPIPKVGGFLPLIPIFAALSALGALGGGAAGIAKAVNDAKNATEQLKESQRHNQTMESIALGKGLRVKSHKKGLGLYLAPYKKNYQ